MKPDNAITGSVTADLSTCSFEEGLTALNCFPLCTLRISKADVHMAQRVVGSLGAEDAAIVFPRVNIIIDDTYESYEWSVEYSGKVFWSPGA
jgi:hypothetical protein